MSDVKFELSLPGLNALMKSGEMRAIENRAAAAIAAAAGPGHDIEYAHPIGFVAIASVRAVTYDAYYDDLGEGTLDNAVKGVRI